MSAPEMTVQAMRDSHAQIRSVPCPRCGAEAGRPCTAPNGVQATIPHAARRSAAADAGAYTPGGAP